MDEPVRQLGRDIADGLRLPQLVGWLNTQIRVRPVVVNAGAGLVVAGFNAVVAASLGYLWPVVLVVSVAAFVISFCGLWYINRHPGARS